MTNILINIEIESQRKKALFKFYKFNIYFMLKFYFFLNYTKLQQTYFIRISINKNYKQFVIFES